MNDDKNLRLIEMQIYNEVEKIFTAIKSKEVEGEESEQEVAVTSTIEVRKN